MEASILEKILTAERGGRKPNCRDTLVMLRPPNDIQALWSSLLKMRWSIK